MICTFFPHSVGHLGWMWTKLMVFKLEFCPWVPYSCLSSHRWFLVFLYLQEGGLSSLSSAVLYLVAAISDSFATSWTIARQAPLFMGILQARTLECIAMHSSRGSSWPRDRTQVSHIAGGYFTIWIAREAHHPTPHSLPLSLILLF